MRLRNSLAALAAGGMLAFMAAAAANAATVVVSVDGKADIFDAGLTTPTDGLLPTAVTVTGDDILDITASGLINCCSGDASLFSGPDGFSNNPLSGGDGSDITNGAGTGVGDFHLAHGSFPLLGVFFGAGLPEDLFIVGSSDHVVAPHTATTLYLGVADAFNFNGSSGFYSDNSGAFSVTVRESAPGSAVAEPASWALMILGFAGAGAALRRRRPALA